MTALSSVTTAGLLSDIKGLVGDANRIVERGRESFFDQDDRTQRMAGRAIVIDVQTAASGLPQKFRDDHPEVAWDQLRLTRDFLALNYGATDYAIIWDALIRDLPRMIRQFGMD